MKWHKTSNRVWRAIGKKGSFIISQTGKLFWSQYVSNMSAFKMPPVAKLSVAKDVCERNQYWEDAE